MKKLHFLSALFLLVYLQGFAQVDTLNDEFNDSQTQSDWLRINETEGWNADQLETFDINTTEADHLVMIPYTTVWFEDYRGPMVYKTVSGDFMFTTEVEISNRTGTGVPESEFSLAGVMLRTPREISNGAEDWTSGGENYVFLSLGFASNNSSYCGGCPAPHLEVKTTTSGNSILRIASAESQRMVLRVLRLGNYIILMRGVPGGDFVVHQRYNRSDFPEEIQVGLVTYTDWPNASSYTPEFHNSHTLNANLNPDLSYHPDLRASFDYARFREISMPETWSGLDLTNSDLVPDVELLALGEIEISSTPCSYLAYESFEYDYQTPLHGLVNGNGWGSSWIVQNDNTDVPGYHIDTTNAPAYSNVPTFGNFLRGGSAYLSVGRALDISPNGPFANYLKDNGILGADSTTLWISSILRKDQASLAPVIAELHNTNVIWNASSPGRIGFGYFGSESNENGIPHWSLRINDSVYITNVPVVVGEATFIVMRMNFDATNGHQIDVFINPNPEDNIPAAPSLTITTQELVEFYALRLLLGNTPNDGGAIDEIRLATSYTCVVSNDSVVINEPPIAVIEASPSSGSVPLIVHFDGSSSTDDSGIERYEWNFGDGNTAEGMNVTHTYTTLGQFTAYLIVSDSMGLADTQSVNITVTDSLSSFPCLSAIRMNTMADCEGQNGSFRLFPGDADSVRLEDQFGNYVAPTTIGGQWDFNDLTAGIYQLTLTSTAGCAQNYDVHIPIDSTQCPDWQPDTCGLDFGVNLSDLAYWNRERPFKDLFKGSGHLISYNSVGESPWNTNVVSEILLDENGYPLELPSQTSIGPQNVRIALSADGYIPIGNYILLYDGTGNIDFFGGPVNHESHGRMEITVSYTGNVWINITESQLGDHIRNIRIIRPEHENNYEIQPFYERFLERLEPFSTIRFMDWQHTNNSPNQYWVNRASSTYRTQAVEEGVAYEYIAQLCNIAQKDAWICVPHAATNNYIRQMAQFFRDNLDPQLNIYLEYSNEVWNWQFEQAHWNDENRPAHLSYPRAYTERALNVFSIWHEEFGVERERVQRVLGTQVAWPWIGQEVLGQAGNDSFDYFSPTWYFGYYTPCYEALVAGDSLTTSVDIINCARDIFRQYFNEGIRQANMDAALYGKSLVYYEGGQHMTSNPRQEPFQDSLYAAQIHPLMYDLYQEVMDSLRLLNSELAIAFTLASRRESVHGSWGHLEDIDQDFSQIPAPKYQALLDNICGQDSIPTVEVPRKVNHGGNESVINLYPNPARSQLIVECETCNEDIQVRILDINGRKMKVLRGPSHQSIDIRSLAKGLYFLQIVNKQKTITKKFVKH